MEAPDEQLAAEVQRGDTEAFGILVARYQDKMLRYGHRFLSDREDIADLVQNAFLKAYENINSFDAGRSFSPWMYRIAHNEFVNALSRGARDLASFVDWDTFFPHPAAPERTDRDALDRELHDALEHCLNRLDPKYREPLVLYYLEELEYRDIADILHIPIATVGVRLHRARIALKHACDGQLE